MKFYTADFHLNNPRIIEWHNRPFRDAAHMNKWLINMCNEKAKSRSDVIFHIGDFCNKGFIEKVACERVPYTAHVDKINATLILLKGNHDKSGKVKSCINYLYTNLGNRYFNVSVGHYPSNCEDGPYQCRRHSIRLCGHVHKSFKYFYDRDRDVLNINMGIDAWRYQIVSESEVINFIDKICKQLNLKFT